MSITGFYWSKHIGWAVSICWGNSTHSIFHQFIYFIVKLFKDYFWRCWPESPKKQAQSAEYCPWEYLWVNFYSSFQTQVKYFLACQVPRQHFLSLNSHSTAACSSMRHFSPYLVIDCSCICHVSGSSLRAGTRVWKPLLHRTQCCCWHFAPGSSTDMCSSQ